MNSEAAVFFLTTVEPTVSDFEKHPNSIRHARLAAMVLYHMADHFALDRFESRDRKRMESRIEDVRDEFLAACPEFALVRDIADATKHAKLSAAKRRPRQLSNSTQLGATPGLFQAPFGTAVFAEGSRVFAILDDKSRRPVLPAVLSVLDAWRRKLDEARGVQ